MTLRKPLVLFLASRANGLQIMAEGLGRSMAGGAVSFMSATVGPPVVPPLVSDVMEEVGVRTVALPVRTPLDLDIFTFDLVITLGDFDQGCRPTLPGMPPHLHWDLPDPRPDSATMGEALRRARDRLRARISAVLGCELLPALVVTRRNYELVLDNLADALVAHTTDGRVFHVNRAAERTTGVSRFDALGQDVRDLLPGAGGRPAAGPEEIELVHPDGSRRCLEMRSTELTDHDGATVGTLLSVRDQTELSSLTRRLKHHHTLGGLVGKDPKMLLLFDLIREVAPIHVPVLIEGESGTGKELVAKAIHDLSPRASKPFVALNCGALPEGILESELFGHVRGAFSGAVRAKRGRFELADGGTLFLDELGELSPRMQVKLLRVLQEQRFEPVGGEQPIDVDVRILSATNQDLRGMMERKQFRRDLFYRLCVFPLVLPPLRERRLDLPVLVEHFLERIARDTGRPQLNLSAPALDLLTRYAWPGNVRELRNALEFAYVKCRVGTIGPEHLPRELSGPAEGTYASKHGPKPKVTKEQVLVALARSNGDKKKAALLLSVGRATLYRYLDHFGLG